MSGLSDLPSLVVGTSNVFYSLVVVVRFNKHVIADMSDFLSLDSEMLKAKSPINWLLE